MSSIRSRGYRAALIAVLGGRCALCNASHDLIIHHQDHNSKNYSIPNLTVLCQKCHSSFEKGEWTQTLWRNDRVRKLKGKLSLKIPALVARALSLNAGDKIEWIPRGNEYLS